MSVKESANKTFASLKKLGSVALAALLSSCGGGSGSATPPQTATAFVRFVNVSPDAGVADPNAPGSERVLFQNSAAQVTVDGAQVTQLAIDTALGLNPNASVNVPSITPYVQIPITSTTVSYVDPSAYTGSGYLQIQGSLSGLQAGKYYTVVLAGSYCLGSMKFYQFSDSPSTSGSVVLYNVAPDMPSNPVEFGTVPAPAGAPPHSLGTVAVGSSASGSASGTIGAYAGTGAAQQILYPSQLNAFDTANAVPFNALTTLSLFYRDGLPSSLGGSCQGALPAPPILQGALTN